MKERDLDEIILAHCRTLPGVVGMRNVPMSKAIAKGHHVAICQLDTWGNHFTPDGDPISPPVIATARDWETLAADLGLVTS
jgi:hypothetical protein